VCEAHAESARHRRFPSRVVTPRFLGRWIETLESQLAIDRLRARIPIANDEPYARNALTAERVDEV
jgi:hypothetical protein